MRKLVARTQLFETMGHVWPFLKPERFGLVLVAAATLGLTVVEVAVPVLVGTFIDSLVSQIGGRRPATPPALDSRTIIALLAAGALLRGYLTFQQRALAGRMGQRVAARMRDALWAHLQELPLDYTRRRGPGRLLMRFIGDARSVQRLVSRGIVQLAQDVLVIAGVLVALVYINRTMGLAVVLIVPLIGGIFWYLNPKLQRHSRDMRRRRSRLSAHLSGRITGLALVKAYGRHESETERVEKLNSKVVKHGNRRETAGGLLLGASAGAVALATVPVLALAAGEVAAGRLTAGQLFTFYALIGLLAPIFARITVADRTLQEAHISVLRLAETLAERPESPVGEDLPPLEVTEGAVSFEEVSFDYPDGPLALDGVSLTAHRGELVVLTGPNGAGKSTLLELLPRFLQPTEGRVVIDGQDTAGVSLGSLRSQIGLVTQDTPLFDGTIAENVTYGAREDVSEESVRRAARLSGVDELVAGLPDGWDTKVREGRRMLSHGQRQRVALARALLADPPIIALDQAATAVDAEAFEALVERLRELARDKTLIIATNRLPVLLAADRVYALERGHALEVSAEALRDGHEKSSEKDAGEIFGGLLPNRPPAGDPQPVKAMPMRRAETERDDHEEDDDE